MLQTCPKLYNTIHNFTLICFSVFTLQKLVKRKKRLHTTLQKLYTTFFLQNFTNFRKLYTTWKNNNITSLDNITSKYIKYEQIHKYKKKVQNLHK